MTEGDRRGHALYVAWGFPPAKSGGVFRMMETANVLVEEGWDVTVVACDVDDLRRYAGVDLTTLEGVDDRIDVVRVPMDLGPFETDLHRWDERRVDDPDGWFADYTKAVEEGFPNSVYALWEAPMLDAVRAVHASRRVDVVIASGGPFVCFAAGLALREEAGVPYVVDYRDSWSLQQFTDERVHGPGSAVERTESRLLTGASEVWFVNRPMLEWHETVYPQIVGKTRVVTNGFDAPALQGLPSPSTGTGPVRFGYLGTLTTAVPLEECLEGYAAARLRDATVAASSLDFYGYLGFYPTPHPELRRQIENAGDAVAWCGPVLKAEVGSAYARLDALVLTFGGTRYVTSGKVFEYMATARPIVSVHDPDNAVRDVLSGYPLWFQAKSLAADDVASAFVLAAHAVASGRAADESVVAAARAHAQRFERRACLRPALQGLPALVAGVSGVPVPTPTGADLVAVAGSEADVQEVVRRAAHRLGWRSAVVGDPDVVPDPDGHHHSPGPGAPAPGAETDQAGEEWLASRLDGVNLAEPGTAEGRCRRLLALAGEEGLGESESLRRDVERAESFVRTGAGVLWSTDPRDARAMRWAMGAVPGAVGCLDLRRAPDTGAGGADEEQAALAGVEVLRNDGGPDTSAAPHDERTREVLARLLRSCRARRLRAPQSRVVVVEPASAASPAAGTSAVAGHPSGDGAHSRGRREAAVVLSSLAVAPGAPTLELAQSLASTGAEVVVIGRAPRPRRRPGGRRTDSRLGRVGLIRVPVPGEREGSNVAPWRRREGVWPDRVLTVQAPLRLRVAHVEASKRLRERAKRTNSPADRALVVASRAVSAGFKVLGLADRVVDHAEMRAVNGLDRLNHARGRPARWEALHPEAARVAAAFGPVLDGLTWDVLHVVDPGPVTLARAAVSERRRRGDRARLVVHPSTDRVDAGTASVIPYREYAAYRELTEVEDAEQGSPIRPTGTATGLQEEQPWWRRDLQAVVGIGAYNMAGQGWQWAKSLERTVPGVHTEVLTIDRGSHLRYPTDLSVPIETFTDDPAWAEEFEQHVLANWTHAVLEGGRSILGLRYGRTYINNVAVLREAGITVGLVFHGSDLRDPALHASRTPWSPFGDPANEVVASLQARRATLYPRYLEFDGPTWVSTPDLLADLPGSTWLPVVVDADRWASDLVPMHRDVPRVVHVPSRSWLKGTEAIEKGIAALRSEGLIDYRRLEGVAPDEMPSVIGQADIVLDQFALGSYGVAAVEAMAAGRVVLGHVMDEVRERCPSRLPVVEATPSSVDSVVRALLRDRDAAREEAERGSVYAREVHDGTVAGRLLAEGLEVRGAGATRGHLGPARRLA